MRGNHQYTFIALLSEGRNFHQINIIIITKYVSMPISIIVFVNGLGDWGSIPGWVIPKTQKMVLDASLLNTQNYKVWIKGKWNNLKKGVAPSPTLWCSSYWKRSLWVALLTCVSIQLRLYHFLAWFQPTIVELLVIPGEVLHHIRSGSF